MSTSRVVVGLRIMIAGLLVQALGAVVHAATPLPQETGGLFVASQSGARLDESLEATIVRRRPVTVRFDQTSLPDTEALPLDFNLFEDRRFVGLVESVRRTTPTRRVLTGRLTGLDEGTFTVVIRDGVMIGNIRVPGVGSFQVRYLGGDVHEIREIDESKFPPCLTGPNDAGAVAPAGGVQRAVGGTCDDDGSSIDLMVVYTAAARQLMGGTTGIEALITLAETETNQAYANSAIATTSVRIVLTHETVYDESGSSSTDRLRLSTMNDGFMDEIHELRDIAAADVVTLMTATLDGCGRAYFSISAGNVPHEELGFNVVRASCATGNYTFGHELAHNQGCRHNRAADPSDGGAFLYSHGYYDPGNAFRTIMGVSSSTVPRIKWFSNPDVLFGGLPTGAPIAQSNSASNALTIDNTAFNVANFRRAADCNNNGLCDDAEIAAGTLEDCNGNGLPDICEEDCNGNGFADECDVANGSSPDCNGNGIPDECEPECNGNSIPDECDIEQGTSPDCTGNGIPDECEPDCNANGAADSCDIADLTSTDVNGNGRPDECEPPILFVNVDAVGLNTGTSWGNALVSLRDALVIAGESVGLVNEIWIVAGTYKPTGPGGDREASFDLVDGVGVYGGFAGTETGRGQRDPAANVTVLSGDLDANDGPDFTNYGDNTYHVVAANNVGATAILDGVTLTAGSAIGPFPHNSGGGVVLNSASPSIVNCLFTLNLATTAGGGLNLRDDSQPLIDRCTFLNNKASVEGAAIGAFFAGANPRITSCVFRGNTANFGGVFFFSIDTRPTVTNCTIVENTGLIDGVIYVVAESQTTINSCVVRNNTGVSIFLRDLSTVVTVKYSNVQGGAAGVTIQEPATLIWDSSNIDSNPLFDTDGLHLLSGSPCIGRGDPSSDASGLDIDGEARVQSCRVDMGADETAFFNSDCNSNGQPDACDIESALSPDININGLPDECEPRETIHVNVSACPGLGSGTALDPYCRIQTAIDAAGDGSTSVVEIIVADGVYSGAGNFDLDFGGKILTLRSENGPASCVVDPGGAGRGFHFHTAEGSPSVLDGFTIRGGVADVGGGIYIQNASPVVRNCIITNCQASLGGGIRIESGAPMISDCVVTGNQADHGGGLSCEGGTASIENTTFSLNVASGVGSAQGGGVRLANAFATLTDCTFDGNNALASNTGDGTGGGLLIQGGSPVVQGCTFTNNRSGSGGGIRFEQNAVPVIQDCVVTNNEASHGGGLSCSSSSGSIKDSTFTGNRATAVGSAEGGGARLTGCSTTLTDCTFGGNSAIASDTGFGRGGGVFLGTGTPLFVRCGITNNEAGDQGSPLVADRLGGGMYLDHSNARIQDSTIAGNSSREGAGVYFEVADSVFERCVIENNTARHLTAISHGGGVYTINGHARLHDCTLRGNVAVNGEGGGAYNINGAIELIQCLVVGNHVTRANALGGFGGALSSRATGADSKVDLIDCTIYGNTSDTGVGGVFLRALQPSGSHIFTLVNSIIWDNASAGDVEDNQLRVDCVTCSNLINHNCIQGWSGAFGGVGNIGSDPDFVDPNGADDVLGTADDNLRIHAGSPVIDAGDNTAVPVTVVTDLAGNPRFVDDPGAPDTGNGVAPLVDMGVYEGGVDCNGNGVPDPQDIVNGTSEDCTGNGFPDECELDCNENTEADSCDILNATSFDCNANDVPDECDLANETSEDCNGSTIPDECEPDGDQDGVIDDCDGCPLDQAKIDPGVCGCGTSDIDSDGDTVPNCVDICAGFDDLDDLDQDGVPDGCDQCPGFDDNLDADSDSVPNGCDICPGFDDLVDADNDTVPDGCDACPGFDDSLDCNQNAVVDGCDIQAATSLDVDNNGIPDECDPPAVTVAGSRYITWAPLPSVDPIALRITSPQAPCMNAYVDLATDPNLVALQIGRLVDTAVFRTAQEWGTVHIRDGAIVAGVAYSLVAETDRDGFIVQSSNAPLVIWAYGDTNEDGVADFVDISNVVAGFQGQLLPGVTLHALDLRPCLPDGEIDFTDISADVDAFQAVLDFCVDPCP